MHGYLSRDGMRPGDFSVVGRGEVISYGGKIVDGTVTDLVPDGRTGIGYWVRGCCSLTAGGSDEFVFPDRQPRRRVAARHPTFEEVYLPGRAGVDRKSGAAVMRALAAIVARPARRALTSRSGL